MAIGIVPKLLRYSFRTRPVVSKAAAVLLHQRMTAGNEGESPASVEAYLELLRSGGNDHPISQLQKAGVDFTTTEATEALVAEMDSLVDRLEEELAKLDS